MSAIFLILSGVNKCLIGGDAAWGIQLNRADGQDVAIVNKLSQTKTLTAQANPPSTTTPTNEPLPQNPNDTEPPNELPQVEVEPRDFPQSSPMIIEELINKTATDRLQRLERLRQLLQQPKPNSDNQLPELELQVRPITVPQTQSKPEINGSPELELRVRPRALPQREISPIRQPQPIGSLQASIGYFHTSNIFSSEFFPREDGLMFYGLRLASEYFPLTSKTYINGSIDGNLIRYIDQSKYNYNKVSFNVGIYQQLSPRMYGELSWSNQQYFYARNSVRFAAGDRFLHENSLRLSLGRRDPLNAKLSLDSFYEFSANFSEPSSRSRLVNSFWVSLNYAFQEPLQVGINYQLNLSDFTERKRDDQYHRVFGQIIYRTSEASNLNLQSGISFGDSTDRNIDFDGWFLTVYYNLKLGEF
ncbi:hypothetical protein [Nostoc sp. FACHB-110]|uniref:hypothetical protein n=1 Tax=Nostoc sp. FACHB-110 TaxID=2692834 RepID=UPI001F55818C|nr:hypothetical protein [Nostoc sp. FACHB-110]